jgi:hypothetical protein
MKVVKGNFKPIWVPVGYTDGSTPLYQGQVVSLIQTAASASEKCGFENFGAAAGVGDATADKVPFGIVVATNNFTELYNATYHSAYINDAQTQAALAARKSIGVEGQFGVIDPAPYVQIELLTAETVIKAPIYYTSYGTAPTEYAETVISTTGLRVTTSALANAPVAGAGTFYCRSGANKGLYRIIHSSSTTAHDFAVAWPNDTAVGDKFVFVPFAIGTTRIQFDANAMCVLGNAAVAAAGDFVWADVLEINLKEAGKEYVIFRFNPFSFLPLKP